MAERIHAGDFDSKVLADVGKVNIAYEPELVEKYEVSSAPTLVFFKDGKEIQRLTGVQKKVDLEKFISENV